MLFETAKSVEIVIILGKHYIKNIKIFYPKILDFMHKHYSVATFVPINLVRDPNSENCLDLIFAAPPCEKVITVPYTNYIISAIRIFMLDMPSLEASKI